MFVCFGGMAIKGECFWIDTFMKLFYSLPHPYAIKTVANETSHLSLFLKTVYVYAPHGPVSVNLIARACEDM